MNRLYQCWQSAIVTVTDRYQTLEQMLASCRQYVVNFAETEQWIDETIDRYRRDDIGTDLATIKQQIDILEVQSMLTVFYSAAQKYCLCRLCLKDSVQKTLSFGGHFYYCYYYIVPIRAA